MIFILPLWWWGFMQGIAVGMMLANRGYYPKEGRMKKDTDSIDERLRRIIEKNRHRIINP